MLTSIRMKLTALAVAGSLFGVPYGGSDCDQESMYMDPFSSYGGYDSPYGGGYGSPGSYGGGYYDDGYYDDDYYGDYWEGYQEDTYSYEESWYGWFW